MKISLKNADHRWKDDIKPDLVTLAEKLKKSKKLVILGVGSELMQDDKAGPEITVFLEKKYGTNHPKVRIFTGYTTPENFTKDIAEFQPEHVIIVDAANLNLAHGELTDLPVERITDFSLGTHKLSLIMMIKFLAETVNPKFSVLAIQYKSVVFGEKMTKEMKAGVKNACAYLCDIIDHL